MTEEALAHQEPTELERGMTDAEKLARLLADLEQLTAEWEKRAADTERFTADNPPVNSTAKLIAGAVLSIGDAFALCARELRERARRP